MDRRLRNVALLILGIGSLSSGRAFHAALSTPSRITWGKPKVRQEGDRRIVDDRPSWSHAALGLTLGATATAASATRGAPAPGVSLWQRPLPILLFVLVVLQKCSSDGLTWYTKAKLHMAYSGSNVALVSEIMKFPTIVLAIAIFSSPKDVAPTLRGACTETPLQLWWVGLLYSAQNILYFVCLKYTSASAYQVLSQSKMLFTTIFMWQMLGRRFSKKQIFAVALLVLGSTFTQLAELKGPMDAGARPWIGAGLAVLSALLSALPNVFYERMLKTQKNQWVSNLQLCSWACFWVIFIKMCQSLGDHGASLPSLAELLHGFDLLVWVIVALKTLNCILVPATLKHADNILYGYAKPVSIVLTVALTSFFTGVFPSSWMLGGIALVVLSIVIYG